MSVTEDSPQRAGRSRDKKETDELVQHRGDTLSMFNDLRSAHRVQEHWGVPKATSSSAPRTLALMIRWSSSASVLMGSVHFPFDSRGSTVSGRQRVPGGAFAKHSR